MNIRKCLNIFKWRKEIKAVGFKDWLWFVWYLNRNEFSHKLNIWNYYKEYELNPLTLHAINKARSQAHRISNILDDLN